MMTILSGKTQPSNLAVKLEIEYARIQKYLLCMGLILLYSVYNNNSQAQSLMLGGGLSLPQGIYSSKDFSQVNAGIAVNGYSLQVTVEDNRLNRVVIPVIQYTYNQNGIDASAIEQYLVILDPNVSGVQMYAPYQQHLLMGAAKFAYHQKGYSLFAKTGVGIGWMKSFGYNYYDSTSFGLIKRKTASTQALVLCVGLGSRIYLSETISLIGGFDYYYAKQDFGKATYVDAAGNSIGFGEVYAPDFKTSNVYMGICFLLNQKKN